MALKHIATAAIITLASSFALSAHAGAKSPKVSADKTESSYMVDKPDTPPIKHSGKRDGQRAETNKPSPGSTKSQR
jgi:hypothetical protein